jgi:hypothetical protein
MLFFPIINFTNLASVDSLGMGTALNPGQQFRLAEILSDQLIRDEFNAGPEAEKPFTPKGKKMGVWIDGKLRLQTRDRDAIDDFAARALADKRNNGVWVAPIGSFVEV